MGLSLGRGIFDNGKQSIIKRKSFIEEALENDKIFQGIYGCSRPFSKDKHADSDFLYIQNNILWFFSKSIASRISSRPHLIGQFHTKTYKSTMLEQTTRL